MLVVVEQQMGGLVGDGGARPGEKAPRFWKRSVRRGGCCWLCSCQHTGVIGEDLGEIGVVAIGGG